MEVMSVKRNIFLIAVRFQPFPERITVLIGMAMSRNMLTLF